MKENGKDVMSQTDIQMLITGLFPNFRNFESKFDLFLQKQDHEIEKSNNFRIDVDRRFTENRNYMVERFVQIDKKFEQVDKKFEESRRDMIERFDQVDKKFEQVDKKFEESRRDMIERFDQVDKKFEQVDKKFEESRRDMIERFDQVDKKFEQVDKKFEQVDKKFEESRRDMIQRFELTDKHFEQLFKKVDKLDDRFNMFIEANNKQSEKRDEIQRKFTMKMFSLAITISIMGVFGSFIKIFGFI